MKYVIEPYGPSVIPSASCNPSELGGCGRLLHNPIVYHCLEGDCAKVNGSDFCMTCARIRAIRDEEKSGAFNVNCLKCDKRLQYAYEPYGGRNGFKCDGCSNSFRTPRHWHHCPKDGTHHPYGFDLCHDCARKAAVEQGQELPEPEAPVSDNILLKSLVVGGFIRSTGRQCLLAAVDEDNDSD